MQLFHQMLDASIALLAGGLGIFVIDYLELRAVLRRPAASVLGHDGSADASLHGAAAIHHEHQLPTPRTILRLAAFALRGAKVYK